MNYELAKELKDAGFLQEGKTTEYIIAHKGYSETVMLYIPTLSELIEACGVAFEGLIYSPRKGTELHKEWYAGGRKNLGFEQKENGDTPEIAVAKLWLALNKNEK